MIRKIIEATFLPQPVSLSAAAQGVPGVRTFGSAPSGPPDRTRGLIQQMTKKIGRNGQKDTRK